MGGIHKGHQGADDFPFDVCRDMLDKLRIREVYIGEGNGRKYATKVVMSDRRTQGRGEGRSPEEQKPVTKQLNLAGVVGGDLFIYLNGSEEPRKK